MSQPTDPLQKLTNLARDLQAEFPGRNGFSTQNLWFMRQLFNEYSQKPKLQPLVREISWDKVADEREADIAAGRAHWIPGDEAMQQLRARLAR